MTLVLIAVFGALGALSRYGVGQLSYRVLGSQFPYGTLAVNVIGCFLLGLLMHVGLTTTLVSDTMRTALSIGFLGAFTTFSTFGYETVYYLEQSDWRQAALNVATNLVLGLMAVFAGLVLGRTMVGGA